MQKLTVKRLGNKWYPDVIHDDVEDLSLDPKLNRVFNSFDRLNTGTITINFIEQKSLLQGRILQFAEEDVYRYFVTDDNFNIKVYLNDFEFEISSDLYLLLETQFNFNFHKTVYSCEII